ncbi:MAG: hypothetical protein GX354_09130 [Firmicutes bacterium]|jgi:hypothetical protein|nr:hypothetical protein [Bacillota bacterium]
MLGGNQTFCAPSLRRFLRPLVVVFLLVFLVASSGCQPQLSQMARLGVKSLGLIIEASQAQYLEPVITTYIQKRLPEVGITGSEIICDRLGIPLGFDYPSLLGWLDSRNLLELRENPGIEYLAAISIAEAESPRHTTSLTIGTEKSEFRLSQYKTVTLHYRIIDTSTGETVFSGEATGKSSDIADLKVGTSGTKVGIQLADEKGLLKEAVLNALKETGLF